MITASVFIIERLDAIKMVDKQHKIITLFVNTLENPTVDKSDGSGLIFSYKSMISLDDDKLQCF